MFRWQQNMFIRRWTEYQHYNWYYCLLFLHLTLLVPLNFRYTSCKITDASREEWIHPGMSSQREHPAVGDTAVVTVFLKYQLAHPYLSIFAACKLSVKATLIQHHCVLYIMLVGWIHRTVFTVLKKTRDFSSFPLLS